MRGVRLRARFGLFFIVGSLFFGNLYGVGATPTAPDTTNGPLAESEVVGSRFGVVTQIATRYGIYGQQSGPMDVAAGSGAGWIREELRWDWVEHPLGQWDWGFTDEMVQDARGRGLEILGLLGYNNSAQTAGTVDFTPPDIGLWKRYVAAVVGRYKGQIHAWEIWNEPDVPHFWSGGVADYVALLRESYATIKAIDPTATVLNGACSNLDLRWLGDFLDQGGAQYTDALAFHPYVMRSSLDGGLYQSVDLAHLRAIGARTGKPWWFTEIGWSSAAGGGDYGGGVGSERSQASYMVRQYVETLADAALDVRHIFWYDFRDDGGDPASVEGNYGLIKSDWRTPKLAYLAYQQMAALLTGATARGTVDTGAGIAYRFERAGTVVDVVWGGGRASLPTAAQEARAYDLGGEAVVAEVSGGQIHLDVGPDPIFVVHSGAAVSRPSPPPATSTFTLPAPRPGNPPGFAGHK